MADDTDTAVKTAQAEPPPQAPPAAGQGATPVPGVDVNAVAPTKSPFGVPEATRGLLTPFGKEQGKPPVGMEDLDRALREDNERHTIEGKELRDTLDARKPLEEALGNLPKPKMPQLQNMPQSPRLQMRSSLETFRMPLMWLGIAGSLLTRRPALNAMAAATGMMEGFAAGDQERIALEQQKFKNSVEAATKQNGLEIEKYNLAIKNRSMSSEDIMNQLRLNAVQFQDKILLDKFNSGNFDHVFKTVEFKEKLQEKALEAQKKWDALNALGGRGGRAVAETQDVKDLAQGIAAGTLPPNLIGFYRQKAPVEAELKRSGFDLAKANLEWTAAQKQISTLNGPQMTRFAGLAQSVINTIDEVKSLAKEMDLGGISLMNQAQLAAYIKMAGNSENGKLATRYVTAINTLKEEFANLAQGGYAPTESVWKLANTQINEGYGAAQLTDAVNEVQRLIRYRVQAIPNFSTMGPNAPNRYGGQRGQVAQPEQQFTGRTATGESGEKLRETTSGQWIP